MTAANSMKHANSVSNTTPGTKPAAYAPMYEPNIPGTPKQITLRQSTVFLIAY